MFCLVWNLMTTESMCPNYHNIRTTECCYCSRWWVYMTTCIELVHSYVASIYKQQHPVLSFWLFDGFVTVNPTLATVIFMINFPTLGVNLILYPSPQVWHIRLRAGSLMRKQHKLHKVRINNKVWKNMKIKRSNKTNRQSIYVLNWINTNLLKIWKHV